MNGNSNSNFERCKTIMAQLGGSGIRGAITYTGGSQLVWSDTAFPSKPEASKVKGGYVTFETGVMWKVSVRGKTWKMLVTLEPDDTYTTRMLDIKRNGQCEVLSETDGVYADDLQTVVEGTYEVLLAAKAL